MELNVKNVTFSYGDHHVLKGCSFSAQAGDLIAVQGPNGVGKSTLFQCMLGLLSGYGGTITCDGDDIKSLSRTEIARRIAYIPQNTAPVFDYTVEETVMMGAAAQLGIFARPGESHRQEAERLLESLGVLRLAKRSFAKLSGGEQQLVLVARALMQKAKILIMDEPTANLDFGNQHMVMSRIKALAEEGYLILFSTHNPDQSFLYANKVLAVKDGAVRAFGRPEEVLDSEMLSELYGIKISLKSFETSGKNLLVCVPEE
ncbi:MAG: ABC transporter ATP-binding protein [Firmicutes bacterium]|nr:ABC transporter ATP-binding protein [Bacillota bacterium]